jgi:hypothetical protein
VKNKKKQGFQSPFSTAFLSLAVYLLAILLFWLSEALFGGGEAYLTYLLFTPISFVAYNLFLGSFTYRKERKIGREILLQIGVLFLALSFGVGMDFLTGRTVVGEVVFADYLLDVIAIVSCPVLILSGARITRFLQNVKKSR